jgi:hypothetical protein
MLIREVNAEASSVQGSYESVVSRRRESRRVLVEFRGSRAIEDEITGRLASDLKC